MVQWLLILFALIGTLLAIKKSTFYKMWALLFNITVSIYLSVILSGVITRMIPKDVAGIEYQKSACILAVAVIIFGTLQAISVSFITSDHEISFPNLFEQIGTCVLGFLSGWFVMAFVAFLICIMPFSKNSVFIKGTSRTGNIKSSVGHVVAICNLVSNISIQRHKNQARDIVYSLTLTSPDSKESANEEKTDDKMTPLNLLKSDVDAE